MLFDFVRKDHRHGVEGVTLEGSAYFLKLIR